MSDVRRTRVAILLAAAGVIGASASGAQAPPSPPPPPAGAVVAAPALIQPPAPVVPVRRGPARVVSLGASTPVAPMAAPRGSPPPDSILRRPERISLANPSALTRPTPVRRNREFGRVRSDVARQPAPAGATGRCKDGTFLTVAPSEAACAAKGGLAVRVPVARSAPPAPPRRP